MSSLSNGTAAEAERQVHGAPAGVAQAHGATSSRVPATASGAVSASAGPAVARPTATSSRSAAYAHVSHAELTDLRAVQRTFDGAYARTALAQLGYAVVILRLFSADFYYVGLAYTLLALLLLLASGYRHSLVVRLLPTPSPSPTVLTAVASVAGETTPLLVHAHADMAHEAAAADAEAADGGAGAAATLPLPPRPSSQAMARGPSALSAMSATSGMSGTSSVRTSLTARTARPPRRPGHAALAVQHTFVTAGSVVALLSVALLLVQAALVVLVLRL